MLTRIFLVFVLMSNFAGVHAADDLCELNAIELHLLLDRLEEEFGEIATLVAEFTQERHLLLFDDIVTARGICAFHRPDSIRLEITHPFQSVLVAHKGAVAKFEHMDGRWEKVRLAGQDAILMITGQIAQWLQGRFRDKTDIYEISARQDENVTVILTPRSKDYRKHITSIELQIDLDEMHVREVLIREPDDSFTRLVFTSEARNVTFRGDAFDTSAAVPARLVYEKPLIEDDRNAEETEE